MSEEVVNPKGFYYPNEIENHQDRQAKREALGLETYELTVPSDEGNYRGGRVQWEANGLIRARIRGERYVRQAENVAGRLRYRAGAANFDRFLIAGHGLHPDHEFDRHDAPEIPNSLHVTLHCDNPKMRGKRKLQTIHQYINDEEKYNLDPWIAECSTGEVYNGKWQKSRRMSAQFISGGPTGEFSDEEIKGLRWKAGKAVQQRADGRFDTGERSRLRMWMRRLVWQIKDGLTYCWNKLLEPHGDRVMNGRGALEYPAESRRRAPRRSRRKKRRSRREKRRPRREKRRSRREKRCARAAETEDLADPVGEEAEEAEDDLIGIASFL
ncbi:hypothetical protein FQN54_006560 [Arachnomyces sp. PD_36]|nr:hypothetical protein FQN54_006560 [Arachnomyces sp. PD_36]